MQGLEYIRFDEINPKEFVQLLNSDKVRAHLIDHEIFTVNTVSAWMQSKSKVDSSPGCKVRGIYYENHLVGWCGVQSEGEKYEIAIIVDEKYWGLGKRVFSDLMRWAKELGHHEVYINFLHTRPEYKFLKKMAKSVKEVELLGNKFTSYQLIVS